MKFNIFGNPQKRLNKKLIEAAAKGNVKEVGRLIDAGAEINQKDTDGPLFMAAIRMAESSSSSRRAASSAIRLATSTRGICSSIPTATSARSNFS